MRPQIPGYEIIAEISRGPTAVVYRALQLSLKRTVLIKALHPQAAAEPDIVQRFEREAQACARLKHPNIVDVFDFGTFEGSFYIVMEYVEGISLKDLLARDGALPLDIALQILTEVLKGLAHAHTRGVLHRDLKPANILLSYEGAVKLTDFGLAAFLDSPGVTAHGSVVGTPAYMSPEQVSGETLDARSDLFSLGATFYEMVTGGQAFGATTSAACLNKVLNEEPPPVSAFCPDFPDALRAVLEKLLQKNRDQRPASCTAVLEALEKFCQTRNIALGQERVARYLENPQGYSFEFPSPRKQRFAPWPAILAAAFVLVILSGYLAFRFFTKGNQPATEPVHQKAIHESMMPAADSAQGAERPRLATVEGKKAAVSSGETRKSANQRSGGEAAPMSPAAELRTGFLEIVCRPWAVVYINDDSVDTTPLRGPVELPSGTHRVLLRNPGFVDYPVEVTLAPGQTHRIEVSLVPKLGRLVLKVSPWAEVYIDGTYQDTTPLSQPLAVPAGRHRLTLKNPAFQPWEQEIEVGAAKTLELNVRLKNEP